MNKNKIRISSKKDLTKLISELGYRNVGGSSHEKWSNGSHSIFIPRHAKGFSRILAERLYKEALEQSNPKHNN